MSRRNNTKVDYKALHEGRKPPSSEDSMINVSHDNDLDASIAQLTMKRDELAKEETQIALLLEIEKQKAEIETMRRQMAALQTTSKASTSPMTHTPASSAQAGVSIDQLATSTPAPTSNYGFMATGHVSDPRPPAQARMDLDPQVYLGGTTTTAGNVKVKCVVDYIPKSATIQEEELDLGNGVTLRVKGGAKPKLESVTPAQWTVANARILADFIKGGQVSTQFTLDYLSYSVKIGELATRYTWSSVIHFDDDYRRRQAEFGFRWGSDSPHSSHLLLRERDAGRKQQPRRGKQIPSREAPFCFNFNNGRPCQFGSDCKYKHCCEICTGDHPKTQHKE